MKRFIFLCCCMLAAAGGLQAETLPGTFDIRNINGHSYIGPVRNQKKCGSCYSFGALAAAESIYNRAVGRYDQAAVDLSESFIIWNLGQYYTGFGGCDGASYDYEELTGIVTHGAVLESDFPYTYPDPGKENYYSGDARIKFSEWYRIAPNDIETMKRVIYTFGALDAAVYADKAFIDYESGVFKNSATAATALLPYYTPTNHAIALVGWNDNPGGDTGYWYLRNSWGQGWAQEGYMNIEYTSAHVALEATYLTYGYWPGPDVTYTNTGTVAAGAWSSGGILNAHAVDIWTGTNSSVDNSGTLSASAVATTSLATARGVYLWGGHNVTATNSGTIEAEAESQSSHAIAYGISMQGGRATNSGDITARADSVSGQALAYGIQAFNGGAPVTLGNTGTITAASQGGNAWAYGVWADSRSGTDLVNQGSILSDGDTVSVGLLLSGNGLNRVTNTGVIRADSSVEKSVGLASFGRAEIVNTGTIEAGTGAFSASVYATDTTRLVLGTGSQLTGPARLYGRDDVLELQGTGTEDDTFFNVESLVMSGTDWTLSASSEFRNINLSQGILTMTEPVSIPEAGVLSGNGTLNGSVTNSGQTSPGNSIGTLTINGDYTLTSTGTLAVEAGGGQADRLVVTGTADIQGGGLTLAPSGYLTPGSYEFLSAGNLTGSFGSLDTPAVFEAAVANPAGATLFLDISRNSYASLGLTSGQESLGAALDRMRPSAAGDMAGILNQVDGMDLAGLRSAMDDLGPGFHSAVSTAALDDIQIRNAYLWQHLAASPPGDEGKGNWRFWSLGMASGQDYGQTLSRPGFRSRLNGIFAGLDRRVGTDLRVGVSGAFTHSKVNGRSSASTATIDAFNGYLYAAWDRADSPAGFHAQAAVGLGRNQYETDRSISFLTRSARAEQQGRHYTVLAGGGYDWTAGGWRLGPMAAVQYTHLREKGFSEANAGDAALRVDADSSKALLGTLGFRIAKPFVLGSGLLMVTEARAEWCHEFAADANTLDAAFLSSGEKFSGDPGERERETFKLSMALTAVFSPRIRGQLQYARLAQDSGGYTSHQAGAGLKILF
ncbi:MAG: autotransporter domain-containing protein [Desulfobacter sp.]|nr:MAG: autotransporter domain-containing protein [Desulfobacter sp.]